MHNSWIYLDTPTPERLAEAVSGLRAPDGRLRGVFALVCDTEADRPAVVWLQQQATAAGVPVVGTIVPGLVVQDGFRRAGVLLLAFDPDSPTTIVPLPHADGRTDAVAIDTLTEFIANHSNPEGGDTLLLALDVRVPDAATLLDRVYLEIGDQVNYAGLCSGSETFQPIPCVFDNERFVGDAALAVILRHHPGASLAHHYRGHEALWVATATSGGHIQTIDGKPAFEVYQALMTSEYGIALDRTNFYNYGVHFPFALNRAQGEPLLRLPVSVEEDGTVYCSGEIRENALLSVVRAVEPGWVGAAVEVGEGVRQHPSNGVLLFYCAGRFLHLGEENAAVEVTALRDTVAPAPVFGALCLGEIGALKHQYPAFHNATITALPWT